MAIRFDKVNFDLLQLLRKEAQISFDRTDYFGALVLQMLFLEATIAVIVVGQLIDKKLDVKFHEIFYQKYPTFFDPSKQLLALDGRCRIV